MKFGLTDKIIAGIEQVFESNSKIDKAYIFGSRAKGNFKEGSDIDIAIKGIDLTFKDILQCTGNLEELNLPYKIDLLDYDKIKEPALKDHIDRVGIEFYSRWKEYKFSELLIDNSISYGIVQPGSHTEIDSIPIIRVNNIRDGYILTENVMKVSSSIEENYKRTRLVGGELLITVVGNVGECAIVPDNLKGWNVARAVSVARIKNGIDKNFIKYAFKTDDIIFQMYGSTNDTVQPTLNLSLLKELKFTLPSFPEQTAIASILSSLDYKIDLLHRQNKTLEQLAETLFRQWFVEESVDFEIGCLGDVISIFDNLRVPISNMERDKMKIGKLYPYYGAAKIMDYINDYIFDGEYILMGEDGTVQTEDGFPILQMPTGKFWVNNHTHVLQAKKPYSNYLVYIFLKRTNINHIVTGAVQPKINQENLKSLDFPVLPNEKVNDFVKITNDYWEKIKSNQSQILTLTKTRDTLLPKLMSGEVRVQMSEP